MAAISDSVLGEETWELARRLYEAGSSFDAYEPIISQILAEGHEYDSRVLIVDAALRARVPRPRRNDEFATRVKNVATSPESGLMSRNLAHVASLWSPALVQHYGWDKRDETFIRLLRRVSDLYKDFKDFVSDANAVLIARQEKAILDNKGEIREGVSPLMPQDLKKLTSREVPCNKDREALWTTSIIGSFYIGQKTLAEWRGDHVDLYLLELDHNGMVVRRSGPLPDHCPATPLHRSPLFVQATPERDDSDSCSAGATVTSCTVYKPATVEECNDDDSIHESRGTRRGTRQRKRPGIQNERAMDSVGTSATPQRTAACSRKRPRRKKNATVAAKIFQCPSPEDSTSEDLWPVSQGTTNIRPGVRLSDPMFKSPVRVEEKLHNKHRYAINQYIQDIREGEGLGEQYRLRAAWLTNDTLWARVGGYQDKEHADFDVLYYSLDEFESQLDAGKPLTKPVVVKESFSDAGKHTVQSFLSLLDDAFFDQSIDVRSLDRWNTWSLPTKQFRLKLSNIGSGHNALNLRNISGAHPPLWTLRRRFRLLTTLVEGLRGGPGKQVSQAIDVAGCMDFSVFGQEGAFSGAHVDSLCGTWVRNLDGIKYWMVVPDTEMDWKGFAEQGPSWVPESARLILLEQDDVLLMPPGIRVVHAVHSPETCLMTGGMLWDDRNILGILDSLEWIGRNQLATNESIAYQLSQVVNALEKYVQRNTVRFCTPSQSPDDFRSLFESAISKLRQLGCDCHSLKPRSTTCGCLAENRRCSFMCTGHPELPPELETQQTAKHSKKRRKSRKEDMQPVEAEEATEVFCCMREDVEGDSICEKRWAAT